MEVIRDGVAGSLESSDVLVTVSPSRENRVELAVESIVMKQYGARIRAVAMEVIESKGLNSVSVCVNDRGALEYTLRARLEAAIDRATQKE
jgi:citrate lyase subunit gamma (acyl carrier protein)